MSLCVQVSEVLSTKTRLSVSGWFHGPPPARAPPYKDIVIPLHPPLPMGVSGSTVTTCNNYYGIASKLLHI